MAKLLPLKVHNNALKNADAVTDTVSSSIFTAISFIVSAKPYPKVLKNWDT